MVKQPVTVCYPQEGLTAPERLRGHIVNDMDVPYLYMPKTKLKTLTTFLMNYAGAQQGSWPTLAAAIIVVLIPTVVLYLIFHKQITEGLSAGATKE